MGFNVPNFVSNDNIKALVGSSFVGIIMKILRETQTTQSPYTIHPSKYAVF